ncbi:unannotated protein [freshwater metagenome]|uniref:Unannotated protein n=1 Tax=freshwater metagenome TaxID=449393 RepID=A0A6J7EZ20_9ZZZZ|nr:hypothetical protein [Actinomycetota bacterium]MSY80287.1 hypothetical protein [Actinomycetota bacterium]
MTTLNRMFAATLAASLLLLAPAACSNNDNDSDDKESTTTTSQAADSGSTQVLPPIMLTATDTTADLKVGDTVVFDLGDPGTGKFVATSSDVSVVEITSDGGSQGSYSTNAGGKALSAGTASVTVVLEGGDTAADPVVYELTVS